MYFVFFTVSDAPVFITEPRDVSKEKGEDASLSCLVDGNPAPTYTWFRNGDYHTVQSTDSFKTYVLQLKQK